MQGFDLASLLRSIYGADAGNAQPGMGTAATVNRGAPQSVTPTDLQSGVLAPGTGLSMGADGVNAMLGDPTIAKGLTNGMGMLGNMMQANQQKQADAQQQMQGAMDANNAYAQQMQQRRQMYLQMLQNRLNGGQ